MSSPSEQSESPSRTHIWQAAWWIYTSESGRRRPTYNFLVVFLVAYLSMIATAILSEPAKQPPQPPVIPTTVVPPWQFHVGFLVDGCHAWLEVANPSNQTVRITWGDWPGDRDNDLVAPPHRLTRLDVSAYEANYYVYRNSSGNTLAWWSYYPDMQTCPVLPAPRYDLVKDILSHAEVRPLPNGYVPPPAQYRYDDPEHRTVYDDLRPAGATTTTSTP